MCIDYIRKEKLHTHNNNGYEIERQLDVADTKNQIQEKMTVSEIAQAKSKLSTSQSKLIDLLYWGGYSLTEIAKIENEPVGTIKSRLHQSLKQLRKYLELEGL